MNRSLKTCLAVLLVAGWASACSAEEPAKDGAAAPAAGATPAAESKPAEEKKADAPQVAPAAAGGAMSPVDRVKATERGKLKNPFDYKDAAIVEEGKKIYMGASCNGCHGGGGGGGMCPPLTNETWVYGGDDDTLFRLITLGSDEFKKTYNEQRKGQENVVGPMPGFATIVTDEAKMWKIIAFIRSVWGGRAEKITW